MTLLQEYFEEAGCAVCGKLTPICEMKSCLRLRISACLKLMESQRKPDANALIQSES